MDKNDTKLVKSYPVQIGRHTFDIGRMPAIVAVRVVEMYAKLGAASRERPTDGRQYMRNVARIVTYVLRNLIINETSWVDRVRHHWAALVTTKRVVLRLPRDEFNTLIDIITTVAFGDKKKEIEVQERAHRAMIDQLGELSESEFVQLFASLRPYLDRLRQPSGESTLSRS